MAASARHAATYDDRMGASEPVAVRHVLAIFAVADVARAHAFYASAFGWPATYEHPVYVELAMPTGLKLGLYARDRFGEMTGEPAAPAPPRGTTSSELYLTVDDVPAALARLLACGGRLVSPLARRPWGDDAAYVADPDGNVIAVGRAVAPST
jgi:predicted enzyme related to lactoylglutathione lyase